MMYLSPQEGGDKSVEIKKGGKRDVALVHDFSIPNLAGT
jgi:hypothetical protein